MVLGSGYGLRIVLMPAVLIKLFGVHNFGAALGTFFIASGVAAALGPPLARPVVDVTGDHGWGIAFAFAARAFGFLAVAPLGLDHASPAARGCRPVTLSKSN